MSHFIATCYNRVVAHFTLPEICICHTFFPLRGAPPLNPHSNTMCLCLILDHFLHFFFKKKVVRYHRLVGNGTTTRLVRRRNYILLLRINKPPSMTSCLRSRNRQRNQQMSTIQLFVILPIWKKKQEFEVMEEDEYYALSLYYLDRL
jgi:hypothetical protein